jgi:hypothetical protein
MSAGTAVTSATRVRARGDDRADAHQDGEGARHDRPDPEVLVQAALAAVVGLDDQVRRSKERAERHGEQAHEHRRRIPPAGHASSHHVTGTIKTARTRRHIARTE